MQPSAIASRLLTLFGENGEHWTQKRYERFSLNEAMMTLHLDFEQLRDYLPDQQVGFSVFNDSSTWPEIKSWLEGIRDGGSQ